jgi:hypothetical protein
MGRRKKQNARRLPDMMLKGFKVKLAQASRVQVSQGSPSSQDQTCKEAIFCVIGPDELVTESEILPPPAVVETTSQKNYDCRHPSSSTWTPGTNVARSN